VIPSDLLLAAYSSGWFPMAGDGGELSWYSPDPRGIIPLDRFHASSRLLRVVRRGTYRIAVDTVFEAVIRACAESDRGPEDAGTWISEEIIQSYCALHRLGHAHSVEAWADDRLVGGLYGVALGGVFFGESMFHRATDASKVALVALIERLRTRGFGLLDTQWVTEHLRQFGAIEIPRAEYLRLLETNLQSDASFA
jgi:leucyl/phenylalanyl-tRNA---protein transferase